MLFIFLSLIIPISLIYQSFKRPYFLGVFFVLVFSLNPIISFSFGEIYYQIILSIMATINIYHIVRLNFLKKWHILYFLFVIIVIIFQLLISDILLVQVFLTLYRFILIPFIGFYSVVFLRYYGKSPLRIIVLYMIINLSILYYRSIFDYSFFGFYNISERLLRFYEYGEALYRPSNLTSPILFSVELGIICAIIVYYCMRLKLSTLNAFLIILMTLPAFYLMQSRSGFIIYIFAVLSLMLFSGKKMPIISIGAIFLLFGFLIYDPYLFSFLDLSDSTYLFRFSTMADFLRTYSEIDTERIFLGLGVGSANYFLESSGYTFYVESFILGFIADSGLIVSFLIMISTIKFIIGNISNRKYYLTIVFILIILVNLISSNLIAFSVVFWLFFLIGELSLSEKRRLIK